MELLDLAGKLFTGELPIEAHHPFASSGQMAEVQPGLAFVDAFANSPRSTPTTASCSSTPAASSSPSAYTHAPRAGATAAAHRDLHARPRRPLLRRRPLREEARTQRLADAARDRARGDRAAVRALPLTAGCNAVINQRQFQAPGLRWPTEFRAPDETYTDTSR